MDENTPQAEETPVIETQEPAMPTGEQKTSEPSVQDGLPEGTSDRTTREFEKLRMDLREERQRREALEGAFKTLQPKEETQTPIYDPDTGYLDGSALTVLQQEAKEARIEAQKTKEELQQFRQEQENRVAFEAHPELNPNDNKTFNKDLHIEARRVILDSMLNPQDYGGKQLSLKEAGDLLKGKAVDTSAVEEARKEGAQEAIEQLTPKEQATLEATGSSGRRSDVGESHETLVERTRKGDISAIAERLNAIKGQE